MEILKTCLCEIALSGLEGESGLVLHLPLALGLGQMRVRYYTLYIAHHGIVSNETT